MVKNAREEVEKDTREGEKLRRLKLTIKILAILTLFLYFDCWNSRSVKELSSVHFVHDFFCETTLIFYYCLSCRRR